jgi:preprotein translocase subunit Sec63
MDELVTFFGGGTIFIFVLITAILAFLMPFFVFRIRNEIISMNQKISKLVKIMGSSKAHYSNSDKNKICPFCAEEIHITASVCKYCARDLPEHKITQEKPKSPQELKVMQQKVAAMKQKVKDGEMSVDEYLETRKKILSTKTND